MDSPPSNDDPPESPGQASDASAAGGADEQKRRSEVWSALDESVRLGLSAKAGWFLGIFFPTFAIAVVSLNDPAVVDALGHFNPMPDAKLELADGDLRIGILGVVWSLLWIRLQAQAAAGLLAGFDTRNGGLTDRDDVSTGSLFAAGGQVARDCFWILVTRFGLSLGVVFLAMAIPTTISGLIAVLEPVVLVLILTLGLLAFLYMAVLEVAAQLALVSCVANRRGPISALQHAWKLISARPRAAVRAGVAHFGLIAAVSVVVEAIREGLGGGPAFVAFFVIVALSGTIHACFWDRVYGILGGWRSMAPLRIDGSDGISDAEAGPGEPTGGPQPAASRS